VAVFFLLFASLIFKLYNLQIEKGGYYAARAEAQIVRAGFLEPRRGTIYFTDKHDNLIPAALNKEYPIVFAVPKKVSDPAATAKLLAPILNLEATTLGAVLGKTDDAYELLAVKITAEQAAKVKDANLKGVYIDNQEFRFYPFQNLSAHVLGFIGASDKDAETRGRYGLESYFDTELRGRRGSASGEGASEPSDGRNLVLTIDRNIQAEAEAILAKYIDKNRATSGTVIVEDPATGKILALANKPDFEPNNYSESPVKNFLNTAVETIYEPGSVFKVITMSAGLDSGRITPETTVNDTGSVVLNNKRIANWNDKAYGEVTMTEIIENSINTGAALTVKKIGYDIFYDYIVRFGFDEKTGISLPGEVKSSLKSLKNKPRDINFATAAFGQGIAVTPIGLTRAISAIANKGVLMKPYLLEDEQPTVMRRVMSAAAAAEVTKMMVSAVKKAAVGQIPNFEIAGKTGTAQIPDFKTGGYTNDLIHTFVGFAPASNPKFTILFKIDKPQVGPLAGFTVVPAFRELAEFIVNYYNIPPDNLQN